MGHWEQIGAEKQNDAKPRRDWFGLVAVVYAVFYWSATAVVLLKMAGFFR